MLDYTKLILILLVSSDSSQRNIDRRSSDSFGAKCSYWVPILYCSSFSISLISRFYDILWCQKDNFFLKICVFIFRSNIKWVLACSPDCPDFRNVYVNGFIFISRGTAFDFVFHYWKRTGGFVSIWKTNPHNPILNQDSSYRQRKLILVHAILCPIVSRK